MYRLLLQTLENTVGGERSAYVAGEPPLSQKEIQASALKGISFLSAGAHPFSLLLAHTTVLQTPQGAHSPALSEPVCA